MTISGINIDEAIKEIRPYINVSTKYFDFTNNNEEIKNLINHDLYTSNCYFNINKELKEQNIDKEIKNNRDYFEWKNKCNFAIFLTTTVTDMNYQEVQHHHFHTMVDFNNHEVEKLLQKNIEVFHSRSNNSKA